MINEVTNDNLEKVSRQFVNLMARSKGTNSTHEAENCVALAQQLLWKYNLDEAQLLSLSEIKQRSKRSYVKDSVRVGKSTWMYNGSFNSRDWKASLLETVAKNFFCRLRPSDYAEYDTVVGEPQNVQMVKDMFAYLEKQIRAIRKEAYKLAEPDLPMAGRRSYWQTGPNKPQQFAVLAWKDSFAKGAVESIKQRLELTQKQNVEAANAEHQEPTNVSSNSAIGYGAALVVQIYNDLDEAYYSFFPYEHPEKIKLLQYQRHIEWQQRMAQLEQERQEREARIEAGLEEPTPKPPSQKEYKRRGRKPQYRSTEDYGAYRTGKVAGNTIELHKGLGKSQGALT